MNSPQTRRVDRLIQGRLRFSTVNFKIMVLAPGRHSSAKESHWPIAAPEHPLHSSSPRHRSGLRLGKQARALARRSSAAGQGFGAGQRPSSVRRCGDGSAAWRAANGGRRGEGAGSRGRRGEEGVGDLLGVTVGDGRGEGGSVTGV